LDFLYWIDSIKLITLSAIKKYFIKIIIVTKLNKLKEINCKLVKEINCKLVKEINCKLVKEINCKLVKEINCKLVKEIKKNSKKIYK
jgi:hypothetical protein